MRRSRREGTCFGALLRCRIGSTRLTHDVICRGVALQGTEPVRRGPTQACLRLGKMAPGAKVTAVGKCVPGTKLLASNCCPRRAGRDSRGSAWSRPPFPASLVAVDEVARFKHPPSRRRAPRRWRNRQTQRFEGPRIEGSNPSLRTTHAMSSWSEPRLAPCLAAIRGSDVIGNRASLRNSI